MLQIRDFKKLLKCYPDVLQIQGNVPDKRLNESLLQPEVFLSLIKSFILDLKTTEMSVREFSWHFSGDLSCNQWATCGEIPVRCLRWLLTLLDFLIMECMLSLEIFSMNVSSSPFLYFTTMNSRGSTSHTHTSQLLSLDVSILFSFLYQGLSCACTRWCLRWSLWQLAEPWSARAGRGGSPGWLPGAPSAEEGNASPSEQAWLRKSQGWCSLFFPWERDRQRPLIRTGEKHHRNDWKKYLLLLHATYIVYIVLSIYMYHLIRYTTMHTEWHIKVGKQRKNKTQLFA